MFVCISRCCFYASINGKNEYTQARQVLHENHEISCFLRFLHPGRLAWNLQITLLERKFIFQTSMIMFHVNLQGCTAAEIHLSTETTCDFLRQGRHHQWPLQRHGWTGGGHSKGEDNGMTVIAMVNLFTLPKTNVISPENRPSQRKVVFKLQTIDFHEPILAHPLPKSYLGRVSFLCFKNISIGSENVSRIPFELFDPCGLCNNIMLVEFCLWTVVTVGTLKSGLSCFILNGSEQNERNYLCIPYIVVDDIFGGKCKERPVFTENA